MLLKTHREKTIDTVFQVVNYLFFGLFTLLCLWPFYYIFINTISSNDLVSAGKITLVPKGFHLNNYVEIMNLPGLLKATMVSISRTVLGALLTVITSSFLAYLICQREMVLRKFWYRFIMITMYFNAGFIPVFLNIRRLGLMNNFLVYIIPTMVVPFYIILTKTYLESVPASLSESAKIDGAGHMRIYPSIILPLSVPILATIAVFSAVGQWNSYLDTLFYVTNSRLFSLQYILFQYLNELNSLATMLAQNNNLTNIDPSLLLTPTAIRYTVSMVIIIPIFIVYPLGQKYFLKGIMLGAVKG